tara:strand:- start:295 stop:690 length:396 start_codon:yes stop_codon:yes gene_type:complete
MAETFKVRYKNHCTPQEQILTDGRWYLDSDCGRKLTGTTDTDATLSAAGTLTTDITIFPSPREIVGSAKDFVYIKNTGSNEVVISLTGDVSDDYVIALAAGEAFASEINVASRVWVKTLSGTSTIEHFSET